MTIENTSSSEPKRVLVTNDDGIDAEGLRAVVAELVAQGYEPIVVAPDKNYSGHSSSIAVPNDNRRVHFQQRKLSEAPDALAYAIDGPPALCALLGTRGAFGIKPDLCISGANEGYNVGPALRYSGTVGAALTAAHLVPSIAVSAESDFVAGAERPVRYDTAAQVAVALLQRLAANPTDTDTLQTMKQVLNVNVPALDFSELAGSLSVVPATTSLFTSQLVAATDSYLDFAYAPVEDHTPETGSDARVVQDGYVAITSVSDLGAVQPTDIIKGFLDR